MLTVRIGDFWVKIYGDLNVIAPLLPVHLGECCNTGAELGQVLVYVSWQVDLEIQTTAVITLIAEKNVNW